MSVEKIDQRGISSARRTKKRTGRTDLVTELANEEAVTFDLTLNLGKGNTRKHRVHFGC